jgi:hypothetical protein
LHSIALRGIDANPISTTNEKGFFMKDSFRSTRLCARSAFLLPVVLAAGLCDGLSNLECRSVAARNVFALLSNNIIATMYGSKVLRQSSMNVEGNLIGIDFRPAQSNPPDRVNPPGLYGFTDTGKIYLLSLNIISGGITPTLVSSLTQPFNGGLQALGDFNPVVDALRLIGSNDQNFAVVNSGGNLNATAQQTAITYAAGDPMAGQDPNLTGGAYNNNIAGTATTIFYALDYANDSMVTIADLSNGSSATGGGRLKTIGKLVDPNGKPINISGEAGIDIYTDTTVGNAALIANGRTLYFINLATVNANLPIGTTQNVVARPLTGGNQVLLALNPQAGVYMDVASTPSPVLATPADLAISQIINVGGFTNGQPRTFDLTVNNQGPDAQISTQLRATALPFKDPVVTPSQGTCTLGTLTASGRLFTCNLGTLPNNGVVTVKVTVTRVADAFATANDLTVQFLAQDPAGSFPLHPNDPDGTNNSQQQTLIFNR